MVGTKGETVGLDHQRGSHGADPHHEESNQQTRADVEKTDAKLAVDHQAHDLVFESGEGRVGADKTNHNDVEPMPIEHPTLGEQMHEEADQEAAGHVDEKRREREAQSKTLCDNQPYPVTRDCAGKSTHADQKILVQFEPFLSARPPSVLLCSRSEHEQEYAPAQRLFSSCNLIGNLQEGCDVHDSSQVDPGRSHFPRYCRGG